MASEKITALVEQVKELTVVELAELVHTLEEVFGVSAAAAAVAAPAAAAAEVEENTAVGHEISTFGLPSVPSGRGFAKV